MKLDLVGKIKNTQLPRSKALFPMRAAAMPRCFTYWI